VCLSVCLSLTGRCSTEAAECRITQTTPHDSPAENLRKTQTRSRPTEAPNAGGVGYMQVHVAEIGNFRREALSTYFGRKFITLSVHLVCLQHVRRDAARGAGFSETADPCVVQK